MPLSSPNTKVRPFTTASSRVLPTVRSVTEQTGLSEKVVIESKDKTKNPVIKIVNKEGEEVKQYNLPVSAHVVVKDNARIKAGDILIKIPRAVGKSGGDITGGLPRVTELFEARNPSNPAIVSEIDGEVSFGKIKRGNREIIITSKQGDVKRYLVPLSRQIIVQENDYVKAGSPLSDGAITPSDILNILGPTKVQEYIVNEVQEVYRMQGVNPLRSRRNHPARRSGGGLRRRHRPGRRSPGPGGPSGAQALFLHHSGVRRG